MENEVLPDLDLQELNEYLKTKLIEDTADAPIVDKKDLSNGLYYLTSEETSQVEVGEGLIAYENFISYAATNVLKEGKCLYINEIDFCKALQLGEEFLILAYNQIRQICFLSNVARVFTIDVNYYASENSRLIERLSYLIEVTKPSGIYLSKDIFLTNGYWLIETRNSEPFVWKTLDPMEFIQLKEQKQEQLRLGSLDKQSYNHYSPAATYLRW